jgi:hypothetical protein
LPETELPGYSIETGVAAVFFGNGATRQATNRRCSGCGLGSEKYERRAKTSAAVTKPCERTGKGNDAPQATECASAEARKTGAAQRHREPVTVRIFSYLPKGEHGRAASVRQVRLGFAFLEPNIEPVHPNERTSVHIYAS